MVNRCTSRLISNWDWNNRGQVTLFIIIGIVLVFAFAGILYMTKSNTTQSIESAEEPLLVTAPAEFQPIQKFTENCLSDVGKRGLLVLGQHGGYIYPDLAGKYSDQDPTEAEGILIEQSQVPYWYYNSEPNTASKVMYSSLRPKLYLDEDPVLSIEAQLARFVKEQLDTCLLNYSSLTTMQIEFPDGGQKKVTARVGETGVIFTLTMNIKATQGPSQGELDQFSVKVPLHLKHYYDVASQITFAQQNYSFLERQGMELISIYGQKKSELLAPVSDVSFDRISTLSWEVTDLQKKIRGMLTSYVPMLRFLGSSNFYRATYPENHELSQQILDNMVLTLNGGEDLEVGFDYLGWEPYLKVNSYAGKVKPEDTHITFWSVFDYTQQRYDTHYDVSYPVLVTVRDANAFDGEGYQLVFALESNIRNNKPAVANEAWKADVARPVYSLTCQEDMWTAGEIKSTVVDSYTKEPIEGVKVTFSVPNQEDCDIGGTDLNGELTSKYPAVYGGSLAFMNPDYLTNFYPINTYKYQNKSAIIGYAVQGVTQKAFTMDRIKNVNVVVKKKELKECISLLPCTFTAGSEQASSCSDPSKEICFFNQGDLLFKPKTPVYTEVINSSRSHVHNYYFMDVPKPLEKDEQVLITLERVSGFQDKIRNAPFSATVQITGNGTTEVPLVPGIYKVMANVIKNKELYIPEERRCGDWTDSDSCFSMTETRTSKFLAGMYDLNRPEQYLTITPEQLYGSQNITFYVLSADLLSTPAYLLEGEHSINGRVMESQTIGNKISDLVNNTEEIYQAILPEFQ
ncbi:MAG: hypothetical protein WCV90_00635 [Candidatus Woesearchaeota archaeon]